MKIKKIFVVFSLLTLIVAMTTMTVPLVTSDLPPGPPYFWLVKITQTVDPPIHFNLTFRLTLDCQPIEIIDVIPVYPEVDWVYPGPNVTLRCFGFEPPAGVAAAIIVTLVIPNDIEFTVWIDWNSTDPTNPIDHQFHKYARQYPVPSTGREGQPHMPIPFHWEKDGPFIPLAPPRLVTFDFEPYFQANMPPEQSHLYDTLGGRVTACGQLGTGDPWHRHYWMADAGVPYGSRAPWLTPFTGIQNITFSAPDTQGIIYLTVPAEDFVDPINHKYWSPRFSTYFWVTMFLPQDGYGWLFTQPGWDVDILTYNNDTGVYWQNATTNPGSKYPDQLAAYRGGFPDVGPDLIPGTADDGFGDGIPDPAGSSVLFLPTKLLVYYDPYGNGSGIWKPLFMAPFPMVLTTATAFDFVNEPASKIHGCPLNSTNDPYNQPPSPIALNPHGGPITGQPWPGPWPKTNKSIAWVKYVTSWSVLEILTAMGRLDVNYDIEEWKILRNANITTPNIPPGSHIGSQYMVGDGDLENSPGRVDYNDLFGLADAYGAQDESFAIGVKPGPPADENFDARFDFNHNDRIDFDDLFALADNYGNFIDP